MMLRSHNRWVLALLLGIVLCLGSRSLSLAQGQPGSEAPSSTSDQDQSNNGPSFSRELARDAREAAGEDENAQFKQSFSIKKLAAITGLSLEHAYWLSLAINFAIVAGFIAWVSKKNLPGIFRGRTTQIRLSLDEARRASEEANQKLAEINQRLSRLDGEIAEMRASAETEAAAEEARIKAAAQEDARKIVDAAEQEIAAAAKAARRELTAYAASLAVSQAARQIRVDSASDEALIRDFAAQLASNGKSQKDGD